MWSKFTNALKGNNQAAKEEQPVSQGGEVLTKVYEQHPNLSMFHTNESGAVEPPSDAQSSPSVHSKRNMFKRMSKAALKDDTDVPPSPSLFNAPHSVSKKVRNQNDSYRNGNGSQLSLNALATEATSSSSQNMPRRSSFDMLRPSPPRQYQDTTRSVKDSNGRPSVDFLRQDTPQDPVGTSDLQAEYEYAGQGVDRFNSKRSILRDPNTPGTGQNVRFFPRDAFKVITPDNSLSTELQSKPQPPLPQDDTPFLDRLARANSPESSSVTRSSSASKSRPSVAEIFSPLGAQENSIPKAESSDMSLSFSHHIVGANDNSNLFDVSQQLDIPSFPPPGLGFDVNAPIFDSNSLDISTVETSDLLKNSGPDGYSSQMTTSTPQRSNDSKGKGKELVAEDSLNGSIEVAAPSPEVVDEAVFHSREKSPKLPSPLHERSQSFSLGQTLYYSLGHTGSDTNKSSIVESEAAYPSSDLKPESLNSSSTGPTPPKKLRSRAMSDTVFQSMLRSSPKSVVPEADINDESSPGLVVYSGGPSEPDPFSANANTYYTPQTMIPTTPPKGAAKHNRKTSKEENLIISLQTQLSMRTELCAQYEADLKARDELVDILSKKLSESEKDETRKKNALRSWKKKVQELEKACRQLEEAVEDSRQESMERSVMDEASGEALRMLHRRIASLEGEKKDWERREHALREEVETLEVLVKERSEDVQNLKENLWTRDESERELKEGIREAKEQIEMMGNISVGAFDEEELRRLLMEKDQKTNEETNRFRTVEFALRQELEELKLKYEGLEVQKASWQEQLEDLKKQQSIREDEFATLKTELEAQWEHTEKATDKILSLEREKVEILVERDAAKTDFEELEARTSNMEVEWNESENKRNELEAELQEVWNLKDSLEKDRGELEDALRHEQEHAESLTHGLQERNNRISQLEQEHQFANENIARLEDNIRRRDEEIAEHTQRIIERESELEHLREEMSSLKREHQRVVSEQNRALQDVAGQQSHSKTQVDELVKAKAEADVEIKTSKEKLTLLREEVERLRRQMHALQQESADKEVKIVQAIKQHSQDKEDLTGLNIALDSKQQELELLKRKLNLRGTAGSTPAQPSKVAHHRRDSSIFNATPISRPPSVISESGTDGGSSTIKKKISSETPTLSAKVAALGKSTRINASGASSLSASATKTVRSGVEGSMGPPPLKSRPSINGTPTPTGRLSSLSRSSSAKAAVAPTAPTHAPHRRLSSVTSDQGQTKSKIGRGGVLASPASSVAEQDEKENVDSTPSSARRRSMIPTVG